MRLNRVVLPAPFGPMISRRSPTMTASETFWVAGNPPKRLFRSATASTGSLIGGLREAPPQLLQAGHQAERHENHHHDEYGAEQRVPAVHIGAHHILDQRDDGRSDDWTGERAGAAEDRHQQNLGGLLERDG